MGKYLDCKTVVVFENAGDRNERWSGSSVKTARKNGERRRTLHNRIATSENDCFAV